MAAIGSFPKPQNITDLHLFLGLANQLAFSLPNFIHLTIEMRKLLSGKTPFCIYDAKFKKVKQILSSNLMVKTFDP